MYQKAYGMIQTLAPLHVGATAGEESGNLNLIFRDQFTKTGIIPGSSIRGRLRSEMYHSDQDEEYWYGAKAKPNETDSTTESFVKIEYASILWLPVFCPGQPMVWVSCPRFLKRYQRIASDTNEALKNARIPQPYTRSKILRPLRIENQEKLFFNFGLLGIEGQEDLTPWFPKGQNLPAVIVDDSDIEMIHDMALYRQSRVKLKDDEKTVDKGHFFNTEALPEDTYLIFPIALRSDPKDKDKCWQPFGESNEGEIYLGGLESIGFGHCWVELTGV